MDKLWLLTGEGQMFSEERTRGAQIPYYNVDVEQGIAHLEHLDAESNLVVPPVGACDLAMCYTGACDGKHRAARNGRAAESRGPRCNYSGGEYVIVCRKIVTLRIVRAADEEGKVRLVAGDRENYDDIVLNVSDIVSVYNVKGKLIINS